jgi:hypothetical protein
MLSTGSPGEQREGKGGDVKDFNENRHMGFRWKENIKKGGTS